MPEVGVEPTHPKVHEFESCASANSATPAPTGSLFWRAAIVNSLAAGAEMTRIANYCAVCGRSLERRHLSGRTRPYCPRCDAPVYFDPKVAVVVFIESDERVLLIQRAVDPGRGQWALPAGFVDHDEAPEAAARRETLEETGFQVRIDKLLAVFPKRDHGLADIIIAYSATVIGGAAQAGDDAAAVGFFARGHLPPLVFYPSITLTGQWSRGELDLSG